MSDADEAGVERQPDESAEEFAARLVERVGDRVVETTRSELASLSYSLSKATQGMTDLQGAVAETREALADGDRRWEDRLLALETRLGEIEEQIRAEVGRTRQSAAALDMLSEEFRSAMGDSRRIGDLSEEIEGRIVGLAGDIAMIREEQAKSSLETVSVETTLRERLDGLGERLSSVAAELHTAIGDASSSTATDEHLAFLREHIQRLGDDEQVTERLDQMSDALAEVTRGVQAVSADRTLLTRIDSLGDSLTHAVDQVRAVTGDLRPAVQGIHDQVDHLREEGLDPAVDGLHQRLNVLGQAIAGLHGRTSAIDALTDGIADQQQAAAEITDRIDALGTDLRERSADLRAAVASVGTEAGTSAEDVGRAVSESREAIEALNRRLDTVTDAADEQNRRIAEAVSELRETVPDLSESLEPLQTSVEARMQAIGEAVQHLFDRLGPLDQTADGVAAIGEAIETLRDETARTDPAFDSVHEAIAALEAAVGAADASAAVSALSEQVEALAARADDQAQIVLEAAADVRDSRPNLTAALGPLAARVEDLADRDAIGRLLDAIAAVEARLEDGEDAARSRAEDARAGTAALHAAQEAQAAQVRADLDDARERVVDAAREAMVAQAGRLDAVVENLTSEIAASRTDAQAGATRIDDLAARLDAAAAEERDHAADLSASVQRVEVALDAYANRPSDLEQALDPLQSRFDAHRDGLASILADSTQATSDHVDRLLGLLEQHREAITQTIDARLETDLAQRLDSLAESAASLLQAHRSTEETARTLAARIVALSEDSVATRTGIGELAAQITSFGSRLTPEAVAENLRRALGESVSPRLEGMAADGERARVQLESALEALDGLRELLDARPDMQPAIAAVQSTVDSIAADRSVNELVDVVRTELGAALAALRDRHDEDADSLRGDLERIDAVLARIRADTSATDAAIAVGQQIEEVAASLDAVQSDTTVGDRIDALRIDYERLATGQLPERLGQVDAALGRLERALAEPDHAALIGRIDEVTATRIDAFASEVANDFAEGLQGLRVALDGVLAQVGEHATRLESIDEHTSTLRDHEPRLDEIAAHIGGLSSSQALASVDRRVDAGIESLLAKLDDLDHEPLVVALAREVEQRTAPMLSQLGDVRADIERSEREAAGLRARVDGLAERILTRLDNEVERLIEAMASGDQYARDDLRRLDGSLAEARREIEVITEVRDGLEMVRSVTQRSVSSDDFAHLAGFLAELQRDLGSTRDNIHALARAVATLRTEMRPTAESSFAGVQAGGALASAAAAMDRLDKRLDTEFDDVGRQLEALASLVHQAVEAVDAGSDGERGEAMAGIREAAAGLRDSVLNAGKQRRERRNRPSRPGGTARGLGPGKKG